MRQQLDNISADILRAYNKKQTMVTDLENKIEKMKQASVVS